MNKIISIISIITIIAVMITITGCSSKEFPPCEYREVATPIKSLDTGNTMSGAFIVGMGGFDTTPKYYVYLAKGNGWILTTYNAENIMLVEDDNNYPAHITYDQINKNNFCLLSNEDMGLENHLRVPSNTIKMNYDTTIGGAR